MPEKERFRSQDYRKLKSQCQRKRQLFVDSEFPPTNASLFLDNDRSSNIVWKRPGELVTHPQLFVEGASVNDVTQGILGNCWFVSACSALTHNENLLKKVIPNQADQEWSKSNPTRYAGIFQFNFWRFGRWLEVVIDDLLPTRDNELLFARSKTVNEFWSALLEKAFAKLYGCYENLVGGQLANALQEVSGGVPATINLKRPNPAAESSTANVQLFNQLRDAFDKKALIVAAIAPQNQEEIEKSLDCGLVKGHAYAVTAITFIDLDEAKSRSLFSFGKADRKRMVRLQNPWGEKEWNGSWSDGSPEWEQVAEKKKKELGITVDEDGEFWMPWDEFCKYFTDISVCQLFNTSHFSFSKGFVEDLFFDEWKKGRKSGAPDDRAGGCLNFSATFCSNNQYRFDIRPNKEGEENTVMLSLTQNEKMIGTKQREPYLTIGMHLMKVEENRRYRLHQPMEAISTSDYANCRSMFLHLTHLEPGRYVVVPTTYAPREEGEFMLRLYTKQAANAHLMTKDKPPEKIWECHCRSIDAVTRLTVIEAEGLFAEKEKSIDPYCMAMSEKERARSPTFRNTTAPKWNWSVVFYRKNARLPIELEVWDENILKNTFLGKATIAGIVDNDSKRVTVNLTDKHGGMSSNINATITIEITSYDDPLYL